MSEKTLTSSDCDKRPPKVIVLRQAAVKPIVKGAGDVEAYEVIVDASCEYIQVGFVLIGLFGHVTGSGYEYGLSHPAFHIFETYDKINTNLILVCI